MITDIGVCFLAFGEEHINEFNNISSQIHDVNIYVCTDNSSAITTAVSIIEEKKVFNFNLKYKAIEQAFKYHNTLIVLDTDVKLNPVLNLDNLDNLDDGLYTIWAGISQKYRGEKISTYQLLSNTSQFDELNDYGNSLKQFGADINNIYFFDEYFFVLKISDDDTKTKFIQTWKEIYETTIISQPKDRHEFKLNGAIESLIISLACHKCGIPILSKIQLKTFFNSITHYGSTPIKTKTSLI
jgi:hypothetical protein